MELRHFEHAADLLRKYHAQDAFCILAEDATALQAHLEPILEDDEVVVYGLNGPPVKVRSHQLSLPAGGCQAAAQVNIWDSPAAISKHHSHNI